jgi:hypothetical protein
VALSRAAQLVHRWFYIWRNGDRHHQQERPVHQQGGRHENPAPDPEVLASRPDGTGKTQPDDYYNAYFASSKITAVAAGLDYWTATYAAGEYPPMAGAPVDAVATMVPLCFGDQGFCDTKDRIFHGTWNSVKDEPAPIQAVHVGGFTTSNFIVCTELPCSTSRVRLHRKDWDPLPGDGLVASFDGNVNLVLNSELVEERLNGDKVVVFRAHQGGIHGRAAFSWTAPLE